ncbi:MAG: hypothetical protein VX569_11080 [Pseudomonadota bacterium]|nr:hypothetical protein [Pseudomonadota bacterium]
MSKWIWIAIGLVLAAVFAALISLQGGVDEDEERILAAADANAAEFSTDVEGGSPNAPTITLAEFQALRTGMPPEQVAEIVGSTGELISESELGGVHTAMYQLEGEGDLGANASVMFQNGELVQKAQIGLR